MKISIYSDNCSENGGSNTEVTICLEMTIFMQEEITWGLKKRNIIMKLTGVIVSFGH